METINNEFKTIMREIEIIKARLDDENLTELDKMTLEIRVKALVRRWTLLNNKQDEVSHE